ncbi:hypothetical protein KJ780_05245 [Candidatus Micrarchaeota archaeon]|nr:hypothetical protein [Candidatus Micrarchaeota archaeon]
MNIFSDFKVPEKKKLISIWKKMGPKDQDHFINQVALALSVWGSDEKGKKILVQIIDNMIQDGSSNLADFGLYPEFLDEDLIGKKSEKVQRAMNILESYRFKHGLPSEPNKLILGEE